MLDVGGLLGLQAGRQPAPVVLAGRRARGDRQIVADYDKLRPGRRELLRQAEAARSKRTAWPATTRCSREIRARYAGVPVGYSESIFQPLGEDLGLKLLTPYSFAKAIAEGTEVTAQDKQTVDRQAARPPDQGVGLQQPERDARRAARERTRARGAHPDRDRHRDAVAGLDSFEQWQVAELEGLERALHEATGR